MDPLLPPFGLHTVTPYLVADDVSGLISFLSKVFDASLRGDPKIRENGSIQHAEITIGNSVIMMGEPMEGIESTRSMLYVYVEDCDQVFADALSAGAESVIEPQLYPHGDRYGGVRDFAGNTWWIVTHTQKPSHGG